MTPGAAHLAAVRARLAQGAPLELARAAVAGGSPQALGLAVALAATGVAVALIEADDWDAARARDALARAGKSGAGKAGAGGAGSVAIATDPGAAAGAALVIEASGGAPADRRALLAVLAQAAPGALPVSLGDLPGAGVALIDLPGDGVIEIRQGADPRVCALVRRLGALPVVGADFMGARLIAALEDEAEALVFEGSTPWEVDAAAEAAGFALGPCAAQDRRGLDRAFARPRVLPLIARMVPEGRLGRKGGVGWYRYPGGGGRVIDPLIEDLAREEAYFAGVTQRAIAAPEIAARLEAALWRCARGLPGDPGVIDLLSVLACAYPEARGGVLFARGGWTAGQSPGRVAP